METISAKKTEIINAEIDSETKAMEALLNQINSRLSKLKAKYPFIIQSIVRKYPVGSNGFLEGIGDGNESEYLLTTLISGSQRFEFENQTPINRLKD